MSSEELKPCPFCGGDQIVHSSVWSSHEGRHVQTYECKGCHSFARVEQWNTRAQLAAIQGGMGETIEPCADLNHHERYRAGWNACLAQHQRITAAMAAEVERLRAALGGMLFAFDDGVGQEWSKELLDFARKLTPAKEYKA